MKWVLNIIWCSLVLLVSPVVLWRMFRHGRYRQGWKEKLFGQLPKFDAAQPVVWFHAVSVGEVLQLRKIVDSFKEAAEQSFQIVVTTSTDTGFELAQERFSDCTVTWFPLDFSWSVERAIRRVNPQLVVLVELELWPNFLRACHAHTTKTALINARMSNRSFHGYSRIHRLVRPMLSGFDVVAAQTKEYADRLAALGAPTENVTVTGSIKFDGVTTDRCNEQTSELRRLFQIQPEESVFIAGSTQSPEEDVALKAWANLRAELPNTRLILVPRHRERFDEVAEMVTSAGHKLQRRSLLTPETVVDPNGVILLDTIGELSACWGLADIAFVGGSFGSRGGQNMLEPAAYGAAVLFGPNTWNFRDIVDRLLQSHGAIQLDAPEDMTHQVSRLLKDTSLRQRLGTAAQRFVQQQNGTLQRTTNLLLSVIDFDREHQQQIRPAA